MGNDHQYGTGRNLRRKAGRLSGKGGPRGRRERAERKPAKERCGDTATRADRPNSSDRAKALIGYGAGGGPHPVGLRSSSATMGRQRKRATTDRKSVGEGKRGSERV